MGTYSGHYAILPYQCSLQAGGIVEASPHDDETFLLVEALRQFLYLLVQLQRLFDQLWGGEVCENVEEAGLIVGATR